MSTSGNSMPFSIYDFYDMVLSRPGMFVGENSLTKVELYLSGAGQVLAFKKFYDLNETEMPELETSEFDQWLFEKLGTDSRSSSHNKLLEDNKSEQLSLEKFIELYKEFRGKDFGVLLKSKRENA